MEEFYKKRITFLKFNEKILNEYQEIIDQQFPAKSVFEILLKNEEFEILYCIENICKYIKHSMLKIPTNGSFYNFRKMFIINNNLHFDLYLKIKSFDDLKSLEDFLNKNKNLFFELMDFFQKIDEKIIDNSNINFELYSFQNIKDKIKESVDRLQDIGDVESFDLYWFAKEFVEINENLFVYTENEFISSSIAIAKSFFEKIEEILYDV